ncbi:GNAT family N-acetyltransferase [Dictyobacter arantiisoli]|uniref:50S ribosomal protein L7 serine acetyltransferase n=1 Tax=Dictyobacter arantiisoli TaxID=2014874 RepID=A0A5A5T658_9CHLR|nr:GNAT family protein [Dictyobacter arantiisoli]GCF06676.1 50S ribosomal protein L7 serine acetyltransferase [Dictyobacter arantiisoli]
MVKKAFYLRIDDDIELKLPDERDATALFQLIDTNRAYLRQWLPWVDYTKAEEDERAFIRICNSQFQDNQNITCAIWYRNQIVGSIAYHLFDWANRKVEIGYWIAEPYQGKGIMTKSCQALIAYAFDELKLNKVEIRAAIDNHRSAAIPQRLGFVQEGVIREAERLNNRYIGLRLFGLLEREWRAQQ